MGFARRIRTVTDLKTGASKLLDQVNEEQQPVVITQDGVPRAVLMDVESYERLKKSLTLLKLVAQGEEAVRARRTEKQPALFERLARKHGFKNVHGRAAPRR